MLFFIQCVAMKVTQSKPKHMTKIQIVIVETIEKNDNGGEWSQIVEAIKNAGIKVKNWLTVRGELQGLINAGTISRTKNLHKEIYVKL